MTTVEDIKAQRETVKDIMRAHKKVAHKHHAIIFALRECLSYAAHNPEFVFTAPEWGGSGSDLDAIKVGYERTLLTDSTNPNRTIIGRVVESTSLFDSSIGFIFFLKDGGETTQIDLIDL
jgi:hypothetical protein